jgi:hypothetical protein
VFDFVAGGLLGEGEGYSGLMSGSGLLTVAGMDWVWPGDHFEW